MEQNLETETAEKVESKAMVIRDYWLGLLVGLLIGLMLMPVLSILKPDLYLKLRFAIIPFFLISVPLGLFAAHAISQKFAFVWQLGKFVVTGVMNVLVDFGILTILSAFAAKYLDIVSTDILFSFGIVITFYSLYKAFSFLVSNINSYFWNKYWTFDERRGSYQSEFIQFFIVSVVGFVINVVAASVVFGYIPPIAGMNYDQWGLMGAAAGSIAGLAWNFLGYKFIVFKK